MTVDVIDLRSDTVTQPTAAMRAAIAAATVGDDVIDIDPTVEALQERVAELLGKEAAIFMPSGTMTNQVAIRMHCRPGDEFICDDDCHVYNYEQGAFAQLSGVATRTVHGENGVIRLEQLRELIRPENEHMVRTRLITLENTHNRGGGRIQPYETLRSICNWAHEHGLHTHLDGARLFNAVVASGISARDWAQHFDTVSVCFSKGLGAPVGSALAGGREQIAEARRHRKVFGGGMRQAGIIAAGALFALDHHIDRLADDHQTAQILADGIRETPGLAIPGGLVDTNMVIFAVAPELGTAAELVDRCRESGLLMLPFSSTTVRAVTHLHISRRDAERAVEIIQTVTGRLLS